MNPKSLLLPIFALFLLASSLAVGVAPAAADQQQELHSDSSPSARFGHTMANINGNLYLFGGLV